MLKGFLDHLGRAENLSLVSTENSKVLHIPHPESSCIDRHKAKQPNRKNYRNPNERLLPAEACNDEQSKAYVDNRQHLEMPFDAKKIGKDKSAHRSAPDRAGRVISKHLAYRASYQFPVFSVTLSSKGKR